MASPLLAPQQALSEAAAEAAAASPLLAPQQALSEAVVEAAAAASVLYSCMHDVMWRAAGQAATPRGHTSR